MDKTNKTGTVSVCDRIMSQERSGNFLLTPTRCFVSCSIEIQPNGNNGFHTEEKNDFMEEDIQSVDHSAFHYS